MTFARRVFTVAWVYGFLSLVPMYFMESWYMERVPPALAHPEFYYGFIGVALAWQVLFVLIARDPARLRPAMLPAVLEKLGWGIAVPVLVLQGRASSFFVPAAVIDLVLGTLFVLAWRKTAEGR
jgi:hypothetical protein